MTTQIRVVVVSLVVAVVGTGLSFLSRHAWQTSGAVGEYTGSAGCRECHEKFYEKWSGSWHGLAMRPFTPEFARENLTAHAASIEIRGRTYQAEISNEGAIIREHGPHGENTYPLEHVLGGKNVFYFLTPRPGGKLQVLPLAFDSRKKEWYDTAGSMVRHVRGQGDEALDWTGRQLTFNGSCYTCHVSQLEKNYTVETDSYQTTWGEPGINCETCHGPGRKHVAAARREGERVKDRLEIIVTRQFSVAQLNSSCAPCHARMAPLDASPSPGGEFFNHYNLVTLENRDFYPDGRDLGENFTYTLWLAGPCAASGQLSCTHCHTSSGRNKHEGANADQACLPCHARHVDNPAAHSRHPPESDGARCVACHMPETSFARMRRHDHTMLPPAPAATIRFESPNACNICHNDRDAQWADQWVRTWYPRDYQAPLLHRGSLIEAARNEDWSKLADMAAYVASPVRNEVFAASLLRLLDRCPDPAKLPMLITALGDPSPLVRSSAAAGLAGHSDPRVLRALAEAAGDPYRVVRIQAAMALSRHPRDSQDPGLRRRLDGAFAEYENSMKCQPDDPGSHFNLGNYYQERGELSSAKSEYENALRQLPSFVPALVNLSIVQARLGDTMRTEWALREAFRYSPTGAEVNFNLGLLLAEQGRPLEAEACLRTAIKSDPTLAEAAYNLAVLVADTRLDETITLCRKAVALRPQEVKYAYTLAFYQHKSGDVAGAISVLRPLVERNPAYADAIALLGSSYVQTGKREAALRLFRSAAANKELPEQVRQRFTALLAAIQWR